MGVRLSCLILWRTPEGFSKFKHVARPAKGSVGLSLNTVEQKYCNARGHTTSPLQSPAPSAAELVHDVILAPLLLPTADDW